MSLRRRLKALERALGNRQPSCLTCGGIQPDSRPHELRHADDPPIERCRECGFWLDENGRAIGNRWNGRDYPGKVVILGDVDRPSGKPFGPL